MKRLIDQFRRDGGGNVAIIVALLILPMLVLAGGATDLARYEAHRAQLQDGVDRAVLAAASLRQTVPVETTVQDYLKSLAFIEDVDLDYDYTVSLNVRTIKVKASYDMTAGFLPLIGIHTLPMVVAATAQEKRSNVEISLMLDVSGSMRFREPASAPTRISLLRPAAKTFVDTILTTENQPTTTISIVPYAGSVNIGSTIFDGIGIARRHNHSSCMEFATTDYGVGLIPFNQRGQVPHFTQNHATTNEAGLDWGWCPSEATAISVMSNNPTVLKNKIDTMRMADGTGSAIAMNWGMMLLEPALRPYIAQAAAAGMVPNQFANRPAPFNDPNTLKVIVLMTDGEITYQRRPNQYDYPRNPEGDRGNYTWYDAGVANNHLQAVCTRAKNNGVLVFTIGFQLNDANQAQRDMKTKLRNCASSASHYYDVAGLDIAGAFNSIATAIQKVKLTQ
ncbi:Flp pilus assembly protein TadG [Devosia lucknowensis]|uniref:Flp pilus assembly protein TadG n=1 Tax=Devosia lucknowensis TaxID=1096929 RepID=A0A1Y6FMD7_9HYPH|nr:pilus assembly protein [Devosia lucknowensis]SMQ75909.1 Flp pilus assembly protein TadG [Devosia lucknowensis]